MGIQARTTSPANILIDIEASTEGKREDIEEEDPTTPIPLILVPIMFLRDMQTIKNELRQFTYQQKLRDRTMDKKLSCLQRECHYQGVTKSW